ncbi:MAG: hypothetical protein HYU39_03175 [Thaumarchaeota archaeon]|nr:hypothetical protein [Nitrososphaerota archaeon]
MKKQSVRQHGGSLEVTIPDEVSKHLDLQSADDIIFLKDDTRKVALIVNARDLEFEAPELGTIKFKSNLGVFGHEGDSGR